MLSDIARERRPEVHAVGLDASLGLDKGHSCVLDIEVATLGKRVVHAIYTKRLRRHGGVCQSPEQSRQIALRTSKDDSGWKLSTVRPELTARVWKDLSLTLPAKGAAETADARVTAR